MDFRLVREDARTVATALQARMLVMQLRDAPEWEATEALLTIANDWKLRESDGVKLSAEAIRGIIARLHRFPDNLDHLLSDKVPDRLFSDVMLCEVVAELGDERAIPRLIAAATHGDRGDPRPVHALAGLGGQEALIALCDVARTSVAISSFAIREIGHAAGVSLAARADALRQLVSDDTAIDKARRQVAMATLLDIANQGSAEAATCLADLTHDPRDDVRNAADHGLKRLPAVQAARQALLENPSAEICAACLQVALRPNALQKTLAAALQLIWISVELSISCYIMLVVVIAPVDHQDMGFGNVKKLVTVIFLAAVADSVRRIRRISSRRCIHCEGGVLFGLASTAGQQCLADHRKRQQGMVT